MVVFISKAAAGSASKTATSYFENDAIGDLNGDGRMDMAFILTQVGGGSVFFIISRRHWRVVKAMKV